MHYVGKLIQQLWIEEPAGRTHTGRRQRTREVPGAVRRRRSEPRTRLD